MHKIIELRETYRLLYSKYSMYIEAVIKFVIALAAVFVINSHIGAMELLKNPLVVVLISLVCAVLPKRLSAMVVMLTIVAHMFSISTEIGIIVLVMFIVMYLLFFRFTPGESAVLVLMPILATMGIPYILPIVLGLVGTPVSAVSLIFGTLVYFILSFIGSDFEAILELGSEDGFKVLSTFIENVVKDTSFYYTIIVFVVVLVMVYILKRLSMDYSWIVGVCAGGIIQIIMFVVGNVMLDMSLLCSIPSAIIGGLISLVIAWFLQFFLHSVDYTKAEKVQFEDDDYYYYVKAVPKIKVNRPNKSRNAVRNGGARRDTSRDVRREETGDTEDMRMMAEMSRLAVMNQEENDSIEFVEDTE